MSQVRSGPEVARQGLVRAVGGVPFRVNAVCRAMALSPDGTTLWVGVDQSLRQLDARSGETRRALVLPTTSSADGMVATDEQVHLGGLSRVITTLDASSLEVVRTWDTGFTYTTTMALCTGALHLLFTGGPDQHARLWDTRMGGLLREFPFWERRPESDYVTASAFSPDGKTLALLTDDGADVWDVASGAHRFAVPGAELSPSWAVFSPDARSLFLVDDGGCLTRLDMRSRKVSRTRCVVPDGRALIRLQITPDGRHLVAIAEDGALYVLTAGDLSEVHRVEAGDLVLASLALTPDGRTALVLDGRGAIVRVLVEDGALTRPLVAGSPAAVAFADESSLVAAHRWGLLARYSLDDGSCVVSSRRAQECVALSARGRRAAVAWPRSSQPPRTDLVDGTTLQVRETIEQDEVMAIDDQGTAYAMVEKAVVVHPSNARIATSKLDRVATAVLSPGGAWLAVADTRSLVRIEVRKRRAGEVQKVPPDARIALDDRGRMILGAKTRVSLVDEKGTVTEFAVLKGQRVQCVATTADGALLAAGTLTGELMVCQREGTRPVLIRAALGSILSLAFSPDGEHIAVGSDDPEVRVFRVAELLAQASTRAAPGRPAKKAAGKAPSARKVVGKATKRAPGRGKLP